MGCRASEQQDDASFVVEQLPTVQHTAEQLPSAPTEQAVELLITRCQFVVKVYKYLKTLQQTVCFPVHRVQFGYRVNLVSKDRTATFVCSNTPGA
ncbi:MAG: hypothetical protein ACRC17_03645 [Culicoidibacterales bacterium]